MTTRRHRQPLRRTMAQEKPTLVIGKQGATPDVVNEAMSRLKRNEVVKIRLLRTARDQTPQHALIQRLAEATQSEVIEIRGHTVTLFKQKPPRKKETEAA